jgi:hypothetical protein
LSLYARGMTVREIQGHLAELYGAEVSPDLISRVTDAVLEEVREWQNRPLDPVYPAVFFDALRVKIRDEGLVENKAAYVALALNPDGAKDILGLWIEQTEGAKFWLKVVNDLKARGVNDILIAVVDGLRGFPEAITSVYPQTIVQTSIVHLNQKQFGIRFLERSQVSLAWDQGHLSGTFHATVSANVRDSYNLSRLCNAYAAAMPSNLGKPARMVFGLTLQDVVQQSDPATSVTTGEGVA